MQYITPATRLPPFLPYPRFLLELPLSETARLVYCLILARILTSQKNGWVDEKGRVYCRYPVLSLAEHCHKSKTTVTVALKDLESQGLLLRRRGGAGYANMLSLRLPENATWEYARQFKEADVIVIAAPYYDLSFPSSLKNYLEAVACVGLTFWYDENEVAQTHTRARKLYYVSTGGGILKKQYGFEYVKALVGEFYHIFDVQGFFAEKLDLLGSDPDAIMQETLQKVDNYFA